MKKEEGKEQRRNRRRKMRRKRIQWSSQDREIKEQEHQPRGLNAAAVWVSWIYFGVLIVV